MRHDAGGIPSQIKEVSHKIQHEDERDCGNGEQEDFRLAEEGQ